MTGNSGKNTGARPKFQPRTSGDSNQGVVRNLVGLDDIGAINTHLNRGDVGHASLTNTRRGQLEAAQPGRQSQHQEPTQNGRASQQLDAAEMSQSSLKGVQQPNHDGKRRGQRQEAGQSVGGRANTIRNAVASGSDLLSASNYSLSMTRDSSDSTGARQELLSYEERLRLNLSLLRNRIHDLESGPNRTKKNDQQQAIQDFQAGYIDKRNILERLIELEGKKNELETGTSQHSPPVNRATSGPRNEEIQELKDRLSDLQDMVQLLDRQASDAMNTSMMSSGQESNNAMQMSSRRSLEPEGPLGRRSQSFDSRLRLDSEGDQMERNLTLLTAQYQKNNQFMHQQTDTDVEGSVASNSSMPPSMNLLKVDLQSGQSQLVRELREKKDQLERMVKKNMFSASANDVTHLEPVNKTEFCPSPVFSDHQGTRDNATKEINTKSGTVPGYNYLTESRPHVERPGSPQLSYLSPTNRNDARFPQSTSANSGSIYLRTMPTSGFSAQQSDSETVGRRGPNRNSNVVQYPPIGSHGKDDEVVTHLLQLIGLQDQVNQLRAQLENVDVPQSVPEHGALGAHARNEERRDQQYSYQLEALLSSNAIHHHNQGLQSFHPSGLAASNTGLLPSSVNARNQGFAAHSSENVGSSKFAESGGIFGGGSDCIDSYASLHIRPDQQMQQLTMCINQIYQTVWSLQKDISKMSERIEKLEGRPHSNLIEARRSQSNPMESRPHSNLVDSRYHNNLSDRLDTRTPHNNAQPPAPRLSWPDIDIWGGGSSDWLPPAPLHNDALPMQDQLALYPPPRELWNSLQASPSFHSAVGFHLGSQSMTRNANLLSSPPPAAPQAPAAASLPNLISETDSGVSSGALNNQVSPGMRTNNFYDNFRSFSRQNLFPNTMERGANRLPATASNEANNANQGVNRTRRKHKINREQNRDFGTGSSGRNKHRPPLAQSSAAPSNRNDMPEAREQLMAVQQQPNYGGTSGSSVDNITKNIYSQIEWIISQNDRTPEFLGQLLEDLTLISSAQSVSLNPYTRHEGDAAGGRVGGARNPNLDSGPDSSSEEDADTEGYQPCRARRNKVGNKRLQHNPSNTSRLSPITTQGRNERSTGNNNGGVSLARTWHPINRINNIAASPANYHQNMLNTEVGGAGRSSSSPRPLGSPSPPPLEPLGPMVPSIPAISSSISSRRSSVNNLSSSTVSPALVNPLRRLPKQQQPQGDSNTNNAVHQDRDDWEDGEIEHSVAGQLSGATANTFGDGRNPNHITTGGAEGPRSTDHGQVIFGAGNQYSTNSLPLVRSDPVSVNSNRILPDLAVPKNQQKNLMSRERESRRMPGWQDRLLPRNMQPADTTTDQDGFLNIELELPESMPYLPLDSDHTYRQQNTDTERSSLRESQSDLAETELAEADQLPPGAGHRNDLTEERPSMDENEDVGAIDGETGFPDRDGNAAGRPVNQGFPLLGLDRVPIRLPSSQVLYEARREVSEDDGMAASLVEEVLASSPELANETSADLPPHNLYN